MNIILLLLIKQQNQTLKRLSVVEKPVFVQDGDKKKVLRVSEIAFVTTNPKGLDIYTTEGLKYVNFESISDMDEIANEVLAEQALTALTFYPVQ